MAKETVETMMMDTAMMEIDKMVKVEMVKMATMDMAQTDILKAMTVESGKQTKRVAELELEEKDANMNQLIITQQQLLFVIFLLITIRNNK